MLSGSSILRRHLHQVREKKMKEKPSVVPSRSERKLYKDCGEHVRESCSFDGDFKYSSLCSVRAAFFVATFA